MIDNPGKGLPSSAEAEKAVLSLVLQYPGEFGDRFAREVSLGMFYHSDTKALGESLMAMLDQSRGIDLTTVMQFMVDSSALEKIGGPGGLAEIFNLGVTGAMWQQYLKIVQDKFQRRCLIRAAWDLERKAAEGDSDLREASEQAEGSIYDAMTLTDKGGENWIHIRAGLREAQDNLEARIKQRGYVGGWPTGFTQIDQMTDGGGPGKFWIVGGRASMGKTTVTLNFVRNMALGEGHYQELQNRPPAPMGIAVLSLEMTNREIVEKVWFADAGLSQLFLRNGFLSRSNSAKLMESTKKLSKTSVLLCDKVGVSVEWLRNSVRELKKKGVSIIVIDHCGLLGSTSKKARESDRHSRQVVSNTLKQIAREYEVMIIGLVQLNRNNEDVKIGGYKGYPTLANIKECGDYEQDADAVILVYRPYYYHRNDNSPPEHGGDPAYCRLIVAKNRSGPVGDEECHWDGATGTVVSKLQKLNSNNEGEQRKHVATGEGEKQF